MLHQIDARPASESGDERVADTGIDDALTMELEQLFSLSASVAERRPDDTEIFERLARSRWLDVVVVDVTAEDNGSLHAATVR